MDVGFVATDVLQGTGKTLPRGGTCEYVSGRDDGALGKGWNDGSIWQGTVRLRSHFVQCKIWPFDHKAIWVDAVVPEES